MGYANGNIANPTYQQVCTGTTDFAETVKVQYDADKVDLPFLIDLYFKTIDLPASISKEVIEVHNIARVSIIRIPPTCPLFVKLLTGWLPTTPVRWW